MGRQDMEHDEEVGSFETRVDTGKNKAETRRNSFPSCHRKMGKIHKQCKVISDKLLWYMLAVPRYQGHHRRVVCVKHALLQRLLLWDHPQAQWSWVHSSWHGWARCCMQCEPRAAHASDLRCILLQRTGTPPALSASTKRCTSSWEGVGMPASG